MIVRFAALAVAFWLLSPLAGAPARADATRAPASSSASPAASPSVSDDAAALDALRKEIAAPTSPDECRCAARKAALRERVKARKLERERQARKPPSAD